MKLIIFTLAIFSVSTSHAYNNPFSLSSASGPKFSEQKLTDSNEAIVYIYTLVLQTGGTLYIDREEKSELLSKGYTWAKLKPGMHLISTSGNAHLPLDVKSGNIYYVRYTERNIKSHVGFSGTTVYAYKAGTPHLELRTKEQSRAEISRTKQMFQAYFDEESDGF